MSDAAVVGSFCEMRILVDEFRDGTSTYAVETGLKRDFLLFGDIEDLDYGFMGDGPGLSRSAFHDKKVRIQVGTPVDEEFLQRVRENRLGDSKKIGTGKIYVGEDSTYDVGQYCGPSPCGSAFVKADLRGEQFELFGDQVEDEPLKIYLTLPLDAFEGIRQQAKEAYESRRILSATVRLIGNALPPAEGRPQELFGLKLHQLDISKDQSYAIQGFEISWTRLFDHHKGRVEYLWPKEGEGYGVGLSIMLSSVRYELAIERPVDRWPVDTSISCLGRITNAHGKPYHGVEVEVKFLEHETNRFGETPKQACFGTFEYFPRDSEPDCFPKGFLPEGLNSRLYIYLRYMPADARSLVHELVGRGPNANVVLSVLLAVEHAAFDGTSKVAGNVRHYGLDVSQPLIATELDSAASKADIERLSKAVRDLHELTESIRTANEEKHRLDRPATTGDVELLRDTVTQTNAVPVLAQLFEYLQYMNSRIAWIWWFSLGALAAGIAAYVASTWPWR